MDAPSPVPFDISMFQDLVPAFMFLGLKMLNVVLGVAGWCLFEKEEEQQQQQQKLKNNNNNNNNKKHMSSSKSVHSCTLNSNGDKT